MPCAACAKKRQQGMYNSVRRPNRLGNQRRLNRNTVKDTPTTVTTPMPGDMSGIVPNPTGNIMPATGQSMTSITGGIDRPFESYVANDSDE